MNCRTCNNPIGPHRLELYPDAVYCGQSCAPKTMGRFPVQGPRCIVCVHCNGPMHTDSLQGRFCSELCRVKHWQKDNVSTCTKCGVTSSDYRGRWTCRKCNAAKRTPITRETRLLKNRPKLGPRVTVCLECGVGIPSPKANTRYCSDLCGRRHNGNYDNPHNQWNRKHVRRQRTNQGDGVTQWERDHILDEYHHRCGYCGGPYEHMDHIMPLAKGGLHEPDNLIPACRICNLHKSDKHPTAWATELDGLLRPTHQ